MELDFKKKIIIGIFIVIVLGISGYLYFDYINNTEVSNIEIENLQNTKENNTEDNIIDKKDEQENLIIVHIAGSVINPGIVKIKEGSRLYEAIESAGGNTEEHSCLLGWNCIAGKTWLFSSGDTACAQRGFDRDWYR